MTPRCCLKLAAPGLSGGACQAGNGENHNLRFPDCAVSLIFCHIDTKCGLVWNSRSQTLKSELWALTSRTLCNDLPASCLSGAATSGDDFVKSPTPCPSISEQECWNQGGKAWGGAGWYIGDYPGGCYYRTSNGLYWYNRNRNSNTDCNAARQCVCRSGLCARYHHQGIF